MSDVSPERRKAPRRQATTIRELALPATVAVEILDVSENGVLVRSSAPLSMAQHCRLRLRLGNWPFVADVNVCRCTRSTPGGDGYRIAAAFVSMTEENRRVLHRFLEQSRVQP